MSVAPRHLPLFPLNTVLFPGGTLPLHVFEPRYRAMTRDCLAGDRRFGVLLIAEGQEVGAPAVPHRLGTTAIIRQVEPQADGRYYLMASGEGRFQVERTWLTEAGYLMGEVVPRPDVIDTEMTSLAALVESARLTLGEYVGRLTPDREALERELARLVDPVQMGGLAASLLRVDNEQKQALLAIDSLPGRLRRLLALLRRELEVLEVLSRPTEAALHHEVVSPN